MNIHQSNNTVTLCSLFGCRESNRKSHFPDLLRDQNNKRTSDQIISHDTDSIRSIDKNYKSRSSDGIQDNFSPNVIVNRW